MRPQGPLRRLAELLALTAFAVAQPVLDVTGRSPDFFLYRRSTPWDLRLLVALVVLGPPLLLWLAESAIGLVHAVAGRFAHLAFVGLLFAAIAVEAGKKALPFTGVPLAFLALLLGAGLAVLAVRSNGFRQAILYATPAPLVFALLFVVTSPAGALTRPAHGGSGVAAVAANRPPVVVVFLDEFPLRSLLDGKGAIDARLFPNFARLAGMSNWYPNATGVSGWTPWAVPAMLTGQYPRRVAAPHYGEYPRNLFTLLSESYDVKAYESIAQLCPPAVCSGVPAGRPTGLLPLIKDTAGVAREVVSPYPAPAREGAEFAEAAAAAGEKTDPKFRFDQAKANQPERFTSFLDSLSPGDRPQLRFLHLLMPHGPHRMLPSGNRYAIGPFTPVLPRETPGRPRVLPKDPNLAVLARERMLLQLVYTDGLIGQLLDRMRQTGLLDKALLMVTADHGVGFTPDGYWRWIDEGNLPDLAWVPLFVKTPGQRAGKVDPRNEQQVDVLPTIADVLDVDVPWRLDGRSVLGEPRAGDAKTWFDEPGKPKTIDGARWLPKTRTGVAGEITDATTPDGLYAVGLAKPFYGKPVASLMVGAPSPVRAELGSATDVRKGTGVVPAMLWGDLDRAAGPSSTWLVVSVNGTIAGGVVALPGLYDGKWRFFGVVNDRYFHEGRNDVTFYTADGSVLHPLGRAS